MQQCEGDAHRGLVPLAVHLCQAVCINMHAVCMHLQMHHTPRRCVHVGVDALTLQEARRRRVAARTAWQVCSSSRANASASAARGSAGGASSSASSQRAEQIGCACRQPVCMSE